MLSMNCIELHDSAEWDTVLVHKLRVEDTSGKPELL